MQAGLDAGVGISRAKDKTPLVKLKKNIIRDRALLLIMIPVVAYFIIFCYLPMYGVIIAFKDFIPGKGLTSGEWVGLKHFYMFFNSIYFGRLVRNTVLISVYGLLWGFPIPIMFALMLNELKDGLYKRAIQTISYLPHFISVVVVVGMMYNFLSVQDGIVNVFIEKFGGMSINFFNTPKYFRTMYIASGIWQEFGWSSIIYLAALSSIDPQLYEAAKIDGANRWQKMIHITIPGILPTIIILLILSLGSIMSVGFEKIILMYNPSTYEVSDVISTYTYRRGILGSSYSFGAAVGFFNSVINFTLLLIFNYFSKKVSSISLW